MTILHASNSTVHVGNDGTFNKDLDVGEGTSAVVQIVENTETMYFYSIVGAISIPSGTWSYRIWLGRGSGGGGNPTTHVKVVIYDNTGAIRDTIIDDSYTITDNSPTLQTGSASSVPSKTIASDEQVGIVVDTVVAGTRELEVRYDDSAINTGDTLMVHPTPSAGGYANDVQGVAAANIGKVMGVATANISKVQGA